MGEGSSFPNEDSRSSSPFKSNVQFEEFFACETCCSQTYFRRNPAEKRGSGSYQTGKRTKESRSRRKKTEKRSHSKTSKGSAPGPGETKTISQTESRKGK